MFMEAPMPASPRSGPQQIDASGRHNSAAVVRSAREVKTPDYVRQRLELAGAALMALQVSRLRPAKPHSAMPEYIQDAAEAYGYTGQVFRPATPTAEQIKHMDEALGWIALIHPERYVLRRIVGARSLINPRTQQPVYSWTKIAKMLGADRRAVRRWYDEGILIITNALNARTRV